MRDDTTAVNQEIVEANLAQLQRMNAVGQLAAGVAHDFNNLLLVITSYAELAIEELPPRHPVRHQLAEILDAAHRAATLTRHLLTFGRQQERCPQELDLNGMLENLSTLLSRLLGENIEFSFLPASDLARVHADPVQIEQVVLNLANNSRDAMPDGGRFTIQTANVYLDGASLKQQPGLVAGPYVLLTITDTGSGIAAEDLPHVFEPFFTTKEPGKGTGLGLATVYGIVQQSGGQIWVGSELNVGTSFKIYLPAVLKPCTKYASPAKLSTPHNIREPRIPPGSETILFVEDEGSVRQPACEFLTRAGYRVLQACDAREALRISETYGGAIHLLITDLIMPGMSGNDLAACLCKRRPETRILYISGYSGPTLLQHGVDGRETMFLEKPFTLKQMSAKIRQALSTGTLTETAMPFPEPTSPLV